MTARARREMTKLAVALGGHSDAFPGLAGLGGATPSSPAQASAAETVTSVNISVPGKPIDDIIAWMS